MAKICEAGSAPFGPPSIRPLECRCLLSATASTDEILTDDLVLSGTSPLLPVSATQDVDSLEGASDWRSAVFNGRTLGTLGLRFDRDVATVDPLGLPVEAGQPRYGPSRLAADSSPWADYLHKSGGPKGGQIGLFRARRSAVGEPWVVEPNKLVYERWQTQDGGGHHAHSAGMFADGMASFWGDAQTATEGELAAIWSRAELWLGARPDRHAPLDRPA